MAARQPVNLYNWEPHSSGESKENITGFSVEEAIEALDGLTPVFFDWRADEVKKIRLGIIAEDSPRIATGPENTTIIPMHVLAILSKVVQEQQRMTSSMRRQLDLRGEM